MKYVDEFRSAKAAEGYSQLIKKTITKPHVIMEICGGQTHTIMKYGIEEMLPEELTVIHGPGCPVCVTPLEMIDKALAIASQDNIIFTSFGDMLRVPGSKDDLLSVKAGGHDIRIVFSPLDAVNIAAINKDKKVVFFAVGFETTAPANAMAVVEAKRRGLKNFSILCAHVLVPPAIEALLSNSGTKIQAILAAGHVCTVMGYEEYIPLSEKYKTPIVVTGFEPVDILQGIYMAVKQLEEKRYEVENQYGRVVSKQGNIPAKELLKTVFRTVNRKWRGIGIIPQSGFKLKDLYSEFDAEKVFDLADVEVNESPLCIAGKVLQGLKKPSACSAFGSLCSPEHPLGAPMVSSEGVCAAYFHYKKHELAVG
jgi:hydrogenase expression/formation protein HypD